ncbi:MAG: hypothetical protein JW822_07410 [Spirochaetales bacterium]|nr:hypothetical protein [Spirochaetales bacterium]
MPQKITFQTNGQWQGGGEIPPILKQVSPLKDWITQFLIICKKLGKKYTRACANDGELIGQEKANICIELNSIIGGLLVLRRYITTDQPDKFSSLTNQSYNFSFAVELYRNTWGGRGKMAGKQHLKISSFSQWYNTILLKKTRELFTYYGKSLEDQQLDQAEQEKFIKILELIVYSIISMEQILLARDIQY